VASASHSNQVQTKSERADENFSTLNAKADEALARWLPRPYPFNIPDLKRAALLFPSEAENINRILESADQNLSRSLSDRIQESAVSASDGSVLLHVVKELSRSKK
jgi:hypothetical protein